MFLKLQPFKYNNTLLRRPTKLSIKYYGPFQIIHKVGPVAYRLQLPPDCIMHDVFHVSLLEAKIKNKYSATPILPEMDSDGRPKVYPVAILDTHMVKIRRSDWKKKY